jgi:cell division transport system permease protein
MISLSTTLRARRGMMREWRLHALSIFSLAVAFVCLGASLLVVTNLRALEDRWAHAGRASVYLKDNAAAEDIESVKQALLRVSGVKQVRYVSGQQARLDFGANQQERASSLAALPAEAFPSTLEVDVVPEMTDAELGDMATKLQKVPSVEDVETYRAWTERLSRLISGGVAASALLAIVVLGAVLAVVGSTIRLALQRRRTEVEVLKLVGATDRFVKGPYILEGSVQGAMGAIGATGLLAALFTIVRGRLDGEFVTLLGLQPQFLPWYAVTGLVCSGALLGALAAMGSLRKLVLV